LEVNGYPSCGLGVGSGRPNIDWCEDRKPETIRTNVIGTLNVADLSYERQINCSVYVTGCIFKYDDAFRTSSGRALDSQKRMRPTLVAPFTDQGEHGAVAQGISELYDSTRAHASVG
jgi:hypothetical protein